MTAIDWVLVLACFALLVLVGVQSIRRVRPSHDFAVAGARITWPILFATVSASFLGGGAAMGNAGNVFDDGYVFMFAFFAFGLQTLLVGRFLVHRLRRYEGAQTVGDVMEIHYGKPARLMAGVLSFGLCAGVLGGQVLAVGTLLNTMFEFPLLVGILVGVGIVLVYATFGGMWAVVQTDVLQFAVLAIFIPSPSSSASSRSVARRSWSRTSPVVISRSSATGRLSRSSASSSPSSSGRR